MLRCIVIAHASNTLIRKLELPEVAPGPQNPALGLKPPPPVATFGISVGATRERALPKTRERALVLVLGDM